jgi:hypothetical protein
LVWFCGELDARWAFRRCGETHPRPCPSGVQDDQNLRSCAVAFHPLEVEGFNGCRETPMALAVRPENPERRWPGDSGQAQRNRFDQPHAVSA